MRKQSQLAVSALISISAAVLPALAENKRSVALVPVTVPARPAPVVVVRSLSGRPSAARVKSMARAGYPATRLQRAAYLKQKGDSDGALIEYLKAAQENPLQVRAFYEQAQIFKEKGYPKLAQSALQQALAIKPEYRDARILLASMHLEAGELSDATRELFRSLGLNQNQSTKPSAVEHHSVSSVSTLTKAANDRIVRSVGTPASQRTEPDAFKFESAPSTASGAARNQTPVAPLADNGAFSAIKQVTDDPTIQAILSKIPGLEVIDEGQGNTNGAKLTPPPIKAPEASRTVTTTSSSGNNRPGAVTVAPITNEQIQQIMKQVQGRTKPDGWKGNGLFGWFGKNNDEPETPVFKPQSVPKISEVTKPVPLADPPAVAGRLRKRRVAAWVDNFLDGKPAEHLAGQDLLDQVEKAKALQSSNPATMDAKEAAKTNEFQEKKAADDARQLNPLKILEHRNGTDSPLPAAMPAANLEPPQSISADGSVAQEPVEDGLSLHLPSAADVNQLLKKAVSWIPFSFFRGDNASIAAPPANVDVPPPLPPQAIPGANAEIAKIASSALSLPAPQPVETPPQSAANDALESIINMMPKEIAASLEQALLPNGRTGAPAQSPVPRAASPVQSPQQNQNNDVVASIVNGGTAESAPSNQNYEQPGFVPNPARPVIAQTGAPLPLANSGIQSGVGRPELPQPGVPIFRTPAAVPLPQSRTESAKAVPAPALPSQAYVFMGSDVPTLGARSTVTPEIPAPSIIAFSPSSVMPQPVAIQQKQIESHQLGAAPVFAPTPYAVPAPMPLGPRPQMPVLEAPAPTGMPAVVPTFAVSAVSTAPQVVPRAVPQSRSNPNVPQLDESVQPVRQVPQLALVPPSVRTAQQATAAQVASLPYTSQPTIYKLGSQGFKFVAPALSVQQQHFYRALRSAKKPVLVAAKPVVKPVPMPPVPEDKMTTRMKYLMENGTGSLGPGEAFMYSEETGEGVLFLPDGNTVRRKLTTARDAIEVARQRRPELLAPKDMQYNLSLLGKILKSDDQKSVQPHAEEDTSGLSVNDILGQSQGFFGWLKDVFKM